MAKSKKSPENKKNTARVVKTEKIDTPSTESDNKNPRVRKIETVRERNEKVAAKAEAKANKQPKRRVRKVASRVAKPLSKPAKIVSSPFRTKPMRFIGRTLSRILWPNYFRNSWKEIKQVTWPNRRDTIKLTTAVLVFALVFGLATAGVDYVLDLIIKRIVFRG